MWALERGEGEGRAAAARANTVPAGDRRARRARPLMAAGVVPQEASVATARSTTLRSTAPSWSARWMSATEERARSSVSGT